MMIRVGVTGPIGSGKTTLCMVWRRLGAEIFFADEEAKKLMLTNSAIRESLIKLFGPETYLDSHTLNKAHLIHEAFHKGRVEELNAVVHPAVSVAFETFCKNEESKGTEIAVKEAALLLKNGRPKNLDFILIVDSARKERLARVMKRDFVNEERFMERNKFQPQFASLYHLANEVLMNNGTLDELERKSEELFFRILRR